MRPQHDPSSGSSRSKGALNAGKTSSRPSAATARQRRPSWAWQILKFFGRAARRLAPTYANVIHGHYQHHGDFRFFLFPKTFNELIQYKKIFRRDTLITLTSDKLKVRHYVKEKIGERFLVPLREVAEHPRQIDFDRLPDAFVIKANHGSEFNCFISEKNAVDRIELNETIAAWLKTDFSSHHEEWAYRDIERRVLVEEMLLQKGEIPDDYKFFVFNGRVRMIQLDQSRHKRHCQNLYDEKWRQLAVEYVSPRSAEPRQPPAQLHEMMRVAEALGRDFEFARIDLYLVRGEIFFGEVTHYPNAGLVPFKPREFDRVLGDVLRKGTPIPGEYYLSQIPAKLPSEKARPGTVIHRPERVRDGAGEKYRPVPTRADGPMLQARQGRSLASGNTPPPR